MTSNSARFANNECVWTLNSVQFLEEYPTIDQHRRRAKCGEDWVMVTLELRNIFSIRSEPYWYAYPSHSMHYSSYLCTRLAKRIVRGLLGGTNTPETRKTSLCWHQKLSSACSRGWQEALELRTPVPRRVWTMWMSTIGDPWENEPMTREEEGGGHRRRAFLRHSLYGGSRWFWIFYWGLHWIHVQPFFEPPDL